MKILIYGINYAPEEVGVGKYTGELGAWLAKEGESVRAISGQTYFPKWEGEGKKAGREIIDGVEVWRCPMWIPRNPGGIKRTLHLLSFAISSLTVVLRQWKWKPDIIICVAPTMFCAPAALMLKKLCGRSTAVWLHIQDYELDAAYELGILKGSIVYKAMLKIESRIFREFDIVTSISEKMCELAISKGVERGKSLIVRNWIELEDVKPMTEEERSKSVYRREYGIKDGEIVLLYSGSISLKQGANTLVEAIDLLKDHKELRWIIACEGPSKELIEKKLRNQDQIIITGLQPAAKLNEWLNFADIHLLPQRRSASDLVMPSKLIGMLASGKPIVAGAPAESSVGEIIEQCGKRVEPEVSIEFANAVLDLVGNKDERLRLGKKGRMIAEDMYGKNGIMKDVKSIIKGLRAGNQRS